MKTTGFRLNTGFPLNLPRYDSKRGHAGMTTWCCFNYGHL